MSTCSRENPPLRPLLPASKNQNWQQRTVCHPLFPRAGPSEFCTPMAARREGGRASEATNTLILLNRHHILLLSCFLSAAIGSSGFRMHNHVLWDTRKRPGMLCFSSWPRALRATGTGATGSKASRSRPAPIVAMSNEMGDGQQESQPLTVGSIIKEWEEVRIRAVAAASPPHLRARARYGQ
jgi:hypothetical protein